MAERRAYPTFMLFSKTIRRAVITSGTKRRTNEKPISQPTKLIALHMPSVYLFKRIGRRRNTALRVSCEVRIFQLISTVHQCMRVRAIKANRENEIKRRNENETIKSREKERDLSRSLCRIYHQT